MPNVANPAVAKVLGSTVAGSFILRAASSGNPITGKVAANFAVPPVAALMPDGTVTAAVTLAELGSGRYGYEYTPTEVGEWSFFQRYDADNEWLDTAQIVAAYQPYRPNRPISGQVLLRDQFGTAITGKTAANFSIAPIASAMPDGSPTAAVTWTEIGAGRYGYSFTPTVAGDWELYYLYDLDNEWLDRFTVTDAPERSADNPVSSTGLLTLYQGDDHAAADGRAPVWQRSDWPDLTGAVVTFTIAKATVELVSQVGVVSDAELPTQTVTVEMTKTQTATLPVGAQSCGYDLAAVLANGHTVTLARGRVTVTADVP